MQSSSQYNNRVAKYDRKLVITLPTSFRLFRALTFWSVQFHAKSCPITGIRTRDGSNCLGNNALDYLAIQTPPGLRIVEGPNLASKFSQQLQQKCLAEEVLPEINHSKSTILVYALVGPSVNSNNYILPSVGIVKILKS